MNKHDRMKAACEERQKATGGECQREICEGIGWCDYCYAAAKKSKEATTEPIEEGKNR